MGMNIVVMSPHTQHNGVTTLASLIAFELSSRGRKTCLTHCSNKSDSIYNYYGIKSFEDKTMNPNRLIKLIREQAIKPEDVFDYCKAITRQMNVFSIDNETLEEDSSKLLMDYILEQFPHEFVIYDLDTDINDNKYKYLVRKADLIILNITQSITELERFNKSTKKIMNLMDNIPQIVVVNSFMDMKGTIKEAANAMGVLKPNNWQTLRFNGWIGRSTNKGELKQLFQKIEDKDPLVIDVASDIRNIANTVLKVKIAKRKSQIEEKYGKNTSKPVKGDT